MIQKKAVAEKISALMIDIINRLDESVALVQEHSSSEGEFEDYRRAVGAVMAEIVLEVMNPLYSTHPTLKPPEME